MRRDIDQADSCRASNIDCPNETSKLRMSGRGRPIANYSGYSGNSDNSGNSGKDKILRSAPLGAQLGNFDMGRRYIINGKEEIIYGLRPSVKCVTSLFRDM